MFKLSSNILRTDETKEVMRDTLSFLSETLSKSLGPYGATTIIQDRLLNHTITKDGYSILKKIFIEEEEARTILDLVIKISRNLVRKVGDGSTSSIIIANSLYNYIESIVSMYNIPPKDLLDILNLLASMISEEIKTNAMPINDNLDEIKYIATVSTNNDEYLGEVIHDLFKSIGKYGFVNLEKSKTNRTYFDKTRGFEIGRGYINRLMVNSQDGKSVEFDNPLIFMTDAILEETDMELLSNIIGNVCHKFGKPLVLIAKGYSSSIETFLHMNLLNHKNTSTPLPLLAIDISTDTMSAYERFADLAINLGCKPYMKSQGESLTEFPFERMGMCVKVNSQETLTSFIDGQGSEEDIKRRIFQIEEELAEKARTESVIDFDDEIFRLKKRLACLQNNMATLYIGGTSENDKDTTKYLVEDALFACKSAIEHGYVLGGNLIIPIVMSNNEFKNSCIDKLMNHFDYLKNIEGIDRNLFNDIYDCLLSAFSVSFKTVLKNCYQNSDDLVNEICDKCINEKKIYNLKKLQYENMSDTKIINSIQTDIEILETAISIIGLLSTSNQFVKLNTVKR